MSGIFRTLDGGDTWAQVPNASEFGQAVQIDPIHPDIIYAGGGGISRSTDGGNTWTDTSAGLTD